MNTASRKIVTLIGTLSLVAGFAASAHAETQWQKSHPRRTEVNDRLALQHARVNQKVDAGKMTAAQGAQIKHEDHQIRQEERDMASQNGGHITKQEQRTLNQQENKVSQQIKSE
ncbi:MAG: hypothetical protein JO002_02060 [Burkholderiaceae bacterium]|nr:hypothetical protein [Burkholderiaceae bacterium]